MASMARVAASWAALRRERAAAADAATRRRGPIIDGRAGWDGCLAGRLVPTTKPACEEADADDRRERSERARLGLLDQRIGGLVLELRGVVGDRLRRLAVLGDNLARRLQRLLEGCFATGHDRAARAVHRVGQIVELLLEKGDFARQILAVMGGRIAHDMLLGCWVSQ